ncbi:sarcoplasmic calcium-binding protein-like [Lingula anatina]|uniref:Sarcoplasmic calcium-binding protein-like n=1 Tax=Lingula anatina TaxID=7574 RepID=A0A1S3HNX7_LINAN|nr:sarcoplasmic calcium-binding protein-like [Lingula anatina]|eukprot:XP_013387735.1 sarcoplasmic calcium-binding protein-like [Lingula anatina]
MAIKLGILMLVVVVASNDVKDSKGNFTGHWISKERALFNIFDVDEDGLVTKKEFIDLTTKRAEQVLVSWRAKAVYGILSNVYQTWWSNENTNYKTSITFEELLPAFEKEVGNTSKALAQVSQDWFHTFDLDCDDKLNVDEYSKFLTILRNTAPVQDIFDDIDRNGSGHIDGEEFLNGFQHSWYDINADPADFIFGSQN